MDLLRALALAGDNPGRESSLAAVLGYELLPAEPEPPAVLRPTSVDQAATAATATPRRGLSRFRPHRLVSVEAVASVEARWTEASRSVYRQPLGPDDSGPWDISGIAPAPAPIVPWTRLWPKLRDAVAHRQRGELDLHRLTAMLAAGRAVRRLPRSQRLCWPNPLPVILDFSDRLTPYWDDWHRLARHLEAQLHRRVRLYRLEGVPQTRLRRLERRLRKGAPQEKWPTLGPQDTLLLASDLGMVDPARPWPRACWHAKLGELQRRGVRVVALAPISARHEQPALTNAAAVVRLSGDSPLRPIGRRMPSAELAGVAPDAHPGLLTLLAMMSIATRVEPGLLRALRRSLPDGGRDVGLEGEAWCHPDLDTAATACALAPRAITQWREAFKNLPSELQERSLDCLRAWHAGLPQAIHHEETLLWRHLAQDGHREEEHAAWARGFFQRLANSLGRQTEVLPFGSRCLQARLADRHVWWVAPTLSGREHYLERLSVAAAQAEPDVTRRGLPDGLDPIEWLKSVNPIGKQNVRLVLGQGGRLRVELADREPTIGSGVTRMTAFAVDRPVLLWAWRRPGQDLVWRPWHWADDVTDGAPTLRSVPGESAEESYGVDLLIHTGQERLLFQALPVPAWAIGQGQDASTLFVEVPWLTKRERLIWEPPREMTWGDYRHSGEMTSWRQYTSGRWRGEGPVGWDDIGLYADLTVAGVTQRFRWIVPGTFGMGSPEDEPGRYDDEVPHEVTLTRGYWLADTACTQALWLAVMGKDPSGFQEDPENPIENVSWDDAQTFIGRLNERVDGLNARLPTEAEWEYACRAGTQTPFWFGATITPEQVNYDGNYPYADGAKGVFREKTVPAKALPANDWGLYQMHGNVWEWCADWFGAYTDGPAIDPIGPAEGALRVLRGGSGFDGARFARSAYRIAVGPSIRNGHDGFRLALGPASTRQSGERSDDGAAGRPAAPERGPVERLRDWFKRR